MHGVVDLRPVKTECRRLLRPEHPVRVVVEAEPDELSRQEAAIKMPILIRLILLHRAA